MLFAHALRAVLDAQAPHQRRLERLDDSLVQAVAKVLHRARLTGQHHRVVVVLLVGVDTKFSKPAI